MAVKLVFICNGFVKQVLTKFIEYIILEVETAMAFIKIQNFVINTSYIAAVKLDNQNGSAQTSVSILLVTPKFPLFQWESIDHNHHHYEWIEFTGQAAIALQDYFTSNNNVIDLLPQCQESSVV